MDLVHWSLLLLAAGLFLLVLELFVPSGGVLSMVAGLCIVAAVVFGFLDSSRMGVIVLATVMILIPLALGSAVRYWPHTPIGRLVLLARPENPDEVLPDSAEYRELQQLVGRHGTSNTKMLPNGMVVIDGQEYDAVGDGVPIDAGRFVQVVDVRTNRLIVREVADLPPPAPEEATDDILSRPIDSLGIDSFEEPLG